jgi:hypothetical protein
VLNATAASDVFTQDVEDTQGSAEPAADVKPAAQSAAASSTKAAEPSGFTLPTSWAKVEDAIKQYGEETWKDWLVFSAQAKQVIFGDASIDSAQKTELRVVSAIAAKHLRDNVDPGEFPPPKREDMIVAWQYAMRERIDSDALELAGPEWQMSPDESDRPARAS